MTNSTPNPLLCGICNFSAFCFTEKNDLDNRMGREHSGKHHRTLQRLEPLYIPKSKFQNLYVIQRGALKTYQTEPDGKELIRGFYFAGEVLGFEAIFNGHYPFSAVALGEALICEVPYEKFLALLSSKRDLQKQILYLISLQLNTGAYLVSSTAEQRLSAFLVDLASRLHPDGENFEFILPMSRQDIGNYLGLTAETISRLCSKLKNNHIIATDRKKIAFLKPDILKQIAVGLKSIDNL